MAWNNIMAEKERIEHDIEMLEQSLGPLCDGVDLSSDSNLSDDDETAKSNLDPKSWGDIAAERQRIQREIEHLERTFGQEVCLLDEQDSRSGITNENFDEDSDEDIDLPDNAESCLQMNLVYQEVLKDKLTELSQMLTQNQEQQKQLMAEILDPVSPQPSSSETAPLKVFLGNFLKPYFKDKLTGLGPPDNAEARERMTKRNRTYEEVKIKRWEGWQKNLLFKSVVSDTMKRLLQPKLSKLEYLTEKMIKAADMDKQILQKQTSQLEKEIDDISAMKDDKLVGEHYDDHDWEKISNVDFEGTRNAEDLRRFWENYLHPSVKKSSWKEDEIEKLSGIVEKYKGFNWDKISQKLGTGRTAFMCLQTYQRFISKDFKKRTWTKEEDQILVELVEKMRIGNFIPYTQISYFMEGREAGQLIYRWTQVLDPSIKKGSWSKEEDEMLIKAVEKYGMQNWFKIKIDVPGRTDSQCRDRYMDSLSKRKNSGHWSKEEEFQLIRLVQKYGAGSWAKIASEMKTRIDSQCLHKWNVLTGMRKRWKPRGRNYTQSHQVKQNISKKRRNRRRIKKEDEDLATSDEDDEEKEPCYMDSDEEPLYRESDWESETCDDYVLTSIDDWLPKQPRKRVAHDIQIASVLQSKKNDSPLAATRTPLGRIRSARSVVPALSSVGPRNTVLDRFGCPVFSFMGSDFPSSEHKSFGKETVMVSMSEVKNVLRSSGNYRKQQTRVLNQKNSQKRTIENYVEKKTQAWHTESNVPASSTIKPGKLSINHELLLGVLPWVGNILMPLTIRLDKRREADVVREKAEAIGLTSTPVFLLFLRVLCVDAQGCKKVIEDRTKMAQEIPNKEMCVVSGPPSPRPRPSQGLPRKITVAEMLYEKRQRDYKRTRLSQRMDSILIPVSCVVGSQSVVFNQPQSQESHFQNSPGRMASVKQDSPPPAKRMRKPAEEAPAVEPDSKHKPQHSKQTRSQTGQQPISSVLSSKGMLCVSGVGTPVVFSFGNGGLPQAVENKQGSTELLLVGTKPGERKLLPKPARLPISPAASGSVLNSTIKENPTLNSSSQSVMVSSYINQQSPLIVMQNSQSTHSNTYCTASDPQNSLPAGAHAFVTPKMTPRLPILQVFQQCTPITSGGSLKGVMASSNQVLPVSHSSPKIIKILKPKSPVIHTPKLSLHSSTKSETVSFDPNLMFLEEAPRVKEWIKGTKGVTLFHLDQILPYLPPSVGSLATLTTLLQQKKVLEKNAMQLLPSTQSTSEDANLHAVKDLIEAQLGRNRGYLLLKARFLSCFTLPSFLATIHPVKMSVTCTDSSDELSQPEQSITEADVKTLQQDEIICRNGGEAAKFTGICLHRNKQKLKETNT